jgi:Rap guanine nucleotide exchange factor 1
MKHLRKMNNFNSYLAILSAVDSGPVQRLDWPKHITDSIKDFSHLIDPKCGFKYLREAVSESRAPCIPHIGLILQDLTILHIANSDFLPTTTTTSGGCGDGECINFWKRWQQFNILERVRCFRRSQYEFSVDAKIQAFFNNFTEYMNEDAQYVMSEKLKPRMNK